MVLQGRHVEARNELLKSNLAILQQSLCQSQVMEPGFTPQLLPAQAFSSKSLAHGRSLARNQTSVVQPQPFEAAGRTVGFREVAATGKHGYSDVTEPHHAFEQHGAYLLLLIHGLFISTPDTWSKVKPEN